MGATLSRLDSRACENRRVTILLELAGSVTVTDDGSASVIGDVEITDAAPFWFILTAEQRAAVAMAQRFQQLGVGIRINGAWIPDREIGNVLTITESADHLGDILTFQLIGEKWSPFNRALLRSKAKVEVYFVTGNVGAEFRKKVFTGWVVSHTFDAGPDGPAATVQCLDAATLYAEKRAKTWTLPPFSGRSRLSIGHELLEIGGIPHGHVDIVGDGGTINKPLAPGDQPIIDYLRDFWGVRGANIDFEDGRLCARRYKPQEPAVLELHAGNLLPSVSIATPDTLAPNVTGVVSVSFSQKPIMGLRTPAATSVVTVGPFAPVTAVGLPAWPATSRVISEVTTKETYLGRLAVRTEQEEWGWYAVRAAKEIIQETIDDPGYEIVPNALFPTYEFPDGSTRGDSVEKFRRLSKTITIKDVDAEMNVVHVRLEKYSLHFIREAIWQVSGTENLLYSGPHFLNDEGEGVIGGREVMGLVASDGRMEGGSPQATIYTRPDELTETFITLAADGTIESEIEYHHYYAPGSPLRKTDGAYGYGVDAVTYWSRPAEARTEVADKWGGLRITTRRYQAINEDQYRLTERITVNGVAQPARDPAILNGAPPRPERAEPETVTQEIRAIVEDNERIALAGERIEFIQPNEFVESPEDARLAAQAMAREAAKRVLTCAVPIESLVHKYRTIRVNLPGSSIHGLKFWVTDVVRDAVSFEERIIAEWYPPEFG